MELQCQEDSSSVLIAEQESWDQALFWLPEQESHPHQILEDYLCSFRALTEVRSLCSCLHLASGSQGLHLRCPYVPLGEHWLFDAQPLSRDSGEHYSLCPHA